DEDEDQLLRTEVSRLGGEGHIARIEAWSNSTFPLDSLMGSSAVAAIAESLDEQPEANRLFQLVLLTPGVFAQGWLPDCVEGEQLRANSKNFGALLSAVVGKPVSVGGWDRVSGLPKRMYRGVPAGAVYLFRAEPGVTGQEILKAFHGKPLHTKVPQGAFYQDLGYGWAVVGRSR
ncbi:MAG: hypothetical protein C4321_08990, partial [Chloroflexota bacterium]